MAYLRVYMFVFKIIYGLKFLFRCTTPNDTIKVKVIFLVMCW
jgi:hypothetical protein